MTIDKMIEVIRKLFNMQNIYTLTREEIEALSMAIKALKQYGVLQEIRQEISQVFANSSISNTDLSFGVLEIIDKHIKENEEYE